MRLVVFLLCLFLVALAESMCPGGWFSFRDSCYFVNPSNQSTWTEAEVNCKAYGGHLADIGDVTENIFVRGLVAGLGKVSVWLGATDQHREGTWISSTTHRPLTYFGQWGPGEPNNDGGENCLGLWHGVHHLWNDFQCNWKIGYVCEKSKKE